MAKKRKRTSPTAAERRIIAGKTGGQCHVCGKRLDGNWQADHVRAHHLGGECAADNYLPSCRTCNRLRWHYTSQRIRKIIRLGVYMLKEIEKQSEVGNAAKLIYHARLQAAKARRK